MDLIGTASREMRFKIMRNIANSFVRLGQFQDAIQSYEAIIEAHGDPQTVLLQHRCTLAGLDCNTNVPTVFAFSNHHRFCEEYAFVALTFPPTLL
jgi:hypothetical protein